MGQDALRTWASVFRAVANEQEWAAEEEDDCISRPHIAIWGLIGS